MSVNISKQDLAKALYYGGLSVTSPQYPTTRDEYYVHDWNGGDVIDYWEDTADELSAMARNDGDLSTIMREAFLNTVERLEYCYKTRQDVINDKYEAQMELADARIELDELRAKLTKLDADSVTDKVVAVAPNYIREGGEWITHNSQGYECYVVEGGQFYVRDFAVELTAGLLTELDEVKSRWAEVPKYKRKISKLESDLEKANAKIAELESENGS